jgi:uncharacterized membrane protein
MDPGLTAIAGFLAWLVFFKFKWIKLTYKNNTSAIFVLARKVTPDKVLEELKGFKGKVLKTSLTKDKEEELRKFMEQA